MDKKVLKVYEYFILLLTSILFFIWSIPNMTSKRNIIIYSLLFLLLFYIKKNDLGIIDYLKKIKIIFFIILLLLIWMVIQAFFISTDTYYVLNEIRGQFLSALVCFFIGILLVNINFNFLSKKILINTLFFSGFLHLVINLIYFLYNYISYGNILYRFEFLIRIDEISFYTNLLYIFFLSEVYCRVKSKSSFLIGNNFFLVFIFMIFILSVSIQGMRLGVITFISTSFFFFLLLVFSIKETLLKKILYISILLGSLLILFNFSLEKDKRWNSFFETLELTLNDDSLYWLNRHKYTAPKLKDGKKVDLSNYLRVAQQINGYKLITEYPEGVGFSRRAYKEALLKKYNDGFGHPHSGLINFILGIGIPGLMIYILFLFTVLKIVLQRKHIYLFFFCIFLIISYHSRTIIDMTFQNHMLQIFFFLIGCSLILNKLRDKSEYKIHKGK